MFLRAAAIWLLVEARGIEPRSDKGRSWKFYGRSFRFNVEFGLPETGSVIPSLLSLFRRTGDTPDEASIFCDAAHRADGRPGGNVTALGGQSVIVVDVCWVPAVYRGCGVLDPPFQTIRLAVEASRPLILPCLFSERSVPFPS